MSERPRPLRLAMAASAVMLALSACGGGSGESRPGADTKVSGVRVIKKGTLQVCTNVPYPPFQFDQGGKIVGFDVDIVDLVARKLGVKQQIVDIDFNAIKSGAALNALRCDLAAAGMTIKEDRKKNLDFTRPYFPEFLSLMARKGLAVKSLDEVKAKKLKVGVQADTTNLDVAKEAGLAPKEYKDSAKLLLALQSKQIDVTVQDLPVVNGWLKRPEVAARFERVTNIDTKAQYGIAVKKGGNPELLKLLNDTITAAVKDGTWARLYKQWIGSEPEQMPAER